MSKLYYKTLRVEKLQSHQIERMYFVFSRYYQDTCLNKFKDDLLKKDSVFLLFDDTEHAIQGFSTIVNINLKIDEKKIRGVFSGDTVIEKKYWGQGTLGKAFLKYLFMQKVKSPFKPLYWYLISKGYKTYLLMANNFNTHYPRYEKDTPPMEQKILNAFGHNLYPKEYNIKTGLIAFSSNDNLKDSLKTKAAPITEGMLNENPKISFFNKKNPNWIKGDELACIAQMTLFMPIYYQLKIFIKLSKQIIPPLRLKINTKKMTSEN